VATKTCPACGAEVPQVAQRCKHCFHDFDETPVKKRGLVILLGFVAMMAIFGASTLAWVFYFSVAEKIVVDAETQSIVISRTSATDTSTERVPFASIEKIEHVMGGENAMFEVVAVTSDGKRYIVKQSGDAPLLGDAEHIAAVVGKPMVQVKNVRGFGD